MSAQERAQEYAAKVGERRTAQYYLSEHETRRQTWDGWKRRTQDATAIYRGDFHLVFPDDTSILERPKVPNVLRLALNDRVRSGSSVPYSIRVDKTSEKESEQAEKRERIVSNYHSQNRCGLLIPYFLLDLNITGANFKLVLPNYKTGFPMIRRLDPRHVWPDARYSPDREFHDVIVAYEDSLVSLASRYPEQEAELTMDVKSVEQTLVKCFEYYGKDEWARVAQIPNKRGGSFAVLLGEPVKNRLDCVPVVCAAQPRPDGEFHGEFDDMIGPLNEGNRIFNMVTDAASEWIYAPIVEHAIDNWEQWGKAVLHASSPQGFARRMPPEQPAPALFSVLGELIGNAQKAATWSEARQGSVQQSIISAAGVNSLQAPFNAAVAMDQQLEAASWEQVYALCLEVDEKYLSEKDGKGWTKSIRGKSNGQSFNETYSPSKDIKGNYQVHVEYSGAQGGDRFSYEIRLTQQHSNGGISDETYMEKLGVVEDVQKERNRVLRERSLKGVLAIIDLQTQAGNPYPAIKMAQLLNEGQDVMQHLEELAQLVVPTAPGGEAAGPPGVPGMGTEAFSEAGAIARGGIAPEENVPGVGSLPPLDELLVS